MATVEHAWLSTADAAAYTGDNPQTIRMAAESGELRGYQRSSGGRWKFRRDDLDRWVKGEQTATGAAS